MVSLSSSGFVSEWCWSWSQLSAGERQITPWMSLQGILWPQNSYLTFKKVKTHKSGVRVLQSYLWATNRRNVSFKFRQSVEVYQKKNSTIWWPNFPKFNTTEAFNLKEWKEITSTGRWSTANNTSFSVSSSPPVTTVHVLVLPRYSDKDVLRLCIWRALPGACRTGGQRSHHGPTCHQQPVLPRSENLTGTQFVSFTWDRSETSNSLCWVKQLSAVSCFLQISSSLKELNLWPLTFKERFIPLRARNN